MGEQKGNLRSSVGKHKKRRLLINLIRYIIGTCIVGIVAYMAYGMYKEGRVRTIKEGNNANMQGQQDNESISNKLIEQTQEKTKKQTQYVAVPISYSGYKVDSRLEVPKISLNTNVLSKYTTNGLKVCASKYYGPNANEVGNYCIAGHNYNQENMFNHLLDLEIGDNVFLTDNKNGMIEYTVYDIYKVKPSNVEPLSQETRGEREITLITCVNYSQNRLVVKAIEKR